MKVVIVHGSPRKGNTYAITQVFKEEMQKQGEIEFVEFFLPKDMPEFCCGCAACLRKGEDKCPHSNYRNPILEQMLSADALIFTTPVFVNQASGCMKSFLDHFAYIFIIHRPRSEMFKKKALVISSTAYGGIKDASKTLSSSLKCWGVNKVYSYNHSTLGTNWQDMSPDNKDKAILKIRKKALAFYKEVASGKRHYPYLFIKTLFIARKMQMRKFKDNPSLDADRNYWKEKGWYSGVNSPFRG